MEAVGNPVGTEWYTLSVHGENQRSLCRQMISYYELDAVWQLNQVRVRDLVTGVRNGSHVLSAEQRLQAYLSEPDPRFKTEIMLGILTKEQVVEFATGEKMEESRDALLALTGFPLSLEAEAALESQLLSPHPEVRGAAGYAMFQFGVWRFHGALDAIIDLARSDPDPGVRGLFQVIARYSL